MFAADVLVGADDNEARRRQRGAQRQSGEMLGCVGVGFRHWGRRTKAAAAAACIDNYFLIYFAAPRTGPSVLLCRVRSIVYVVCT